jgi:hypothetical protein
VPSGELAINHCKIVYKPDIALAMYRELASHIEQIENVNYPQSISEKSQLLIKNILNHYGNWTSDPKD